MDATVRSRSTDEVAVRALFQQLMDTWNRGDGTAYGALFSADADYVTFDGSHIQGREAIARSHQQLFDTHLKGSRLGGKINRVRFLGPDVVLVHTTGSAILAGKSISSPERDSIQTLVATRQDGEWYWVAFHNTRCRPMTSNTASMVIWLLFDRLWKWFGAKPG